MVSTLILASLVFARQRTQGLFQATFPQPTGLNGLEEYLLAYDLMVNGYWSGYGDWVPPEGRAALLSAKQQLDRVLPDTAKSTPDPKLVELEQRLDGMTMLQVRQEESKAFHKPMTLVFSGNEKPCYFPPAWNGSKFPLLSGSFDIAKLGTDLGYVSASEGHTDAEIEDLGAVLVFTNHVCRTTYIASMAANINQARVLADFAAEFERFSLPDANRIDAIATYLLQQPPSFLDAYRAANSQQIDHVPDLIRQLRKNSVQPVSDKAMASIQKIMNSMSDGEVELMIQRIQKSLADTCQGFLSRFSGPEQMWLSSDATDDSSLQDPDLNTPEDVEAYFEIHWQLPDITKPRRLIEALKSRVMLRELRLHARIIAFRWEQDRLPNNLGELQLPQGYDFDPLSNQRFFYELKPS